MKTPRQPVDARAAAAELARIAGGATPRPAPTKGRQPTPPHRSRRESMAELADDPAYLEFKAKLGEPLTPDERAALDAHRAGGGG